MPKYSPDTGFFPKVLSLSWFFTGFSASCHHWDLVALKIPTTKPVEEEGVCGVDRTGPPAPCEGFVGCW